MMRPYARNAKARWTGPTLAVLLIAGAWRALAAVPQAEIEVSPDATPQIQQVKPNQGAAGDEVTLTIDGRNFSPGAYVSFSNPAVRVVSTRRLTATQLEAKLAIGKNAQPGTGSLFVSNPASSVAEAPFTIAGGQAPAPAAPAAPTNPVTPAAPAPLPAEVQPSEPGTPEVTGVDPDRVTRGSRVDVKVTGKNFSQGVKVAFSNPGIRVLKTDLVSPTELTTQIQVIADAATGAGNLFVVDPKDRETEAKFEVAEGSPMSPQAPAKAPTTAEPPGTTKAPATSEPGTAEVKQFEVYNLGEVATLLRSSNKPKGTLSISGNKLSYQEAGKEVFSVALADIKEVDVNTILGVNTGTFHLILNSGKSYNFVATSLRSADSQAIVDALRHSVQQ